MRAPRLVRVLWASTALVVCLLLARFFVADVYRVDSSSMRPTLFGGRDRADGEEDSERVLVLYQRDPHPERFDLVVVRSSEGGKPLVKRVVGLPGDQDLLIRDGDLFLGRERLPAETPRPAPIPVYDDRYHVPEDAFGRRGDGTVWREGSEWVVESGPVPPGNLLHYQYPLLDDYLDRQHRRVPGLVDVNDAVLELEFRLEGALGGQRLHFQLIEESDTFDLVLAAEGELSLSRRNRPMLQESREPGSDVLPARERILARTSTTFETGKWYRLSFANIDNHLRARSPDLGFELTHSYDENAPLQPIATGGPRHFGPRVRFGVENGRARFRSVRILRDLYYTDSGKFACGEQPPLSLGPDDYFLLGDHSAASFDSRHFGPIKADDLVGRPLAALWPSFRLLRPTGP